MSQDVRQRKGDRYSPAVMLLHNLCTSCSDPLLFSFLNTRGLKRDFYKETPPFPLPKHPNSKKRKDHSASSTRPPSSRSRQSQARSEVSLPDETLDTPASPTSHHRLVSGPTASDAHQEEEEEGYRIHANDSMATAVVQPSPLTAFFGGLSPFSTKSLHYLFSEDEAASNRKTLFPQSRELFLHPAQLYSPPSIKDAASLVATSEAQSLEPPSPAISLPPILTVDEIEAALFKQFPPPPPPSQEGPGSQDESDIPVPDPYPQYASYPSYTEKSALPLPEQHYWPAHPLGPTPDQLHQAHHAPHYSSYFPPTPIRTNYIPAPHVMTASQAVQTLSVEDEYSNVASGLVCDVQTAPSSIGAGRPGTGSSQGSLHSGPAPAQFAYHSSPLLPSRTAHGQPAQGSKRYESPLPPTTRPSTSSGGAKSEDDDASYVGSGTGRKNTGRGKEAPKRTGKLPNSTTAILKDWLMLHVHHPYPTEEEKKELCATTNLTMNQVSNWFINARRRILPSLGTVTVSGGRKQFTPVASAPAQRLNAVGARLPPHRSAGSQARAAAQPYPAGPAPPPGYYAAPPPHPAYGYPGYHPMMHLPMHPPVMHPAAPMQGMPLAQHPVEQPPQQANGTAHRRMSQSRTDLASRPATGSSRHSG